MSARAANFVSAIGHRFGLIEVIGEPESGKGRRVECRCDCGTVKLIRIAALRQGTTTSCGCRRVQQWTTHGMARHASYAPWLAMVRRCTNPSHPSFADYGGRGIGVCERWMSIDNFIEDMGVRPPRMELDRIDNNGNYEPGNCRWTDRRTQLNNRRVNHRIEIDGVTKTLSEWATHFGVVSGPVASGRIHYGWEPIRAFKTPVRRKAKAIT